jgi:hypothetical protein
MTGLLGVVVAALGGLAVGVERQRSGHAIGPHARFGGVRTFTLIGGTAGLAGWLTRCTLRPRARRRGGGVGRELPRPAAEIDGTSAAALVIGAIAAISAGSRWRAASSRSACSVSP